jgi:energy-coupling factor transporter ATP-binding protein EcfA2
MVLGNAATTRPTILLLDEPETNLHPSLQLDFLLSVVNYAQRACIFSTHSVGLARSVAERVYSFQRQANQIAVKPFEATANYIEFIGELSFSAFKELGGNRILLVEGVNDVKTVQQLLRIAKKEHTTVILPLGGDQLAVGGREAELAELTRLSDNICALVDSEKSSADAQPSKRRSDFAATCKKLGIDICVTERRAIENYFPDGAVKAALGDGFSALAPYQRLSESKNALAKPDRWKIARHMSASDISDTDLGFFIVRI